MQVIDTDVAFPFTAAASRSQAALRRELREKALEEKTPCILKCGLYEILRTTSEAICHNEQQNLEHEVLLKAMMRYGYLAYRPDFEQQKVILWMRMLLRLRTNPTAITGCQRRGLSNGTVSLMSRGTPLRPIGRIVGQA